MALYCLFTPAASRHSSVWGCSWYWWLSRKQKVLNRLAQLSTFSFTCSNRLIENWQLVSVVWSKMKNRYIRTINNRLPHRRQNPYRWRDLWIHHPSWNHHHPLLSFRRRRYFSFLWRRGYRIHQNHIRIFGDRYSRLLKQTVWIFIRNKSLVRISN